MMQNILRGTKYKVQGMFAGLVAAVAAMMPMAADAQLSGNADKFLGNITTSYQVDFGNEKFYTLWNQITCENESKWGSVEGTKGSFNWSCDNAFNYAKNHHFTYKFHALVWGAQYPGWFKSEMAVKDRYAAIVKWFDAVKKKYPTLPLIDVVNEAVGMHQQGNPLMKESLGGEGKTGCDWLIKAFEMAHERWPEAILIYNDYNTFQWDTDNYINLVRDLRDNGAPIDAYGCQSHDLTDCDFSKFKSAESKIQSALKMPMYSTEYDIGTNDDNLQLQRYQEQIPYLWEKDYCAGITLWGYIYGRTWTGRAEDGTQGNSGLIRDGKDRPAMTWLRQYMKSDAAKNAKSPFPGMKKEASIYVRPASKNVAKGDVLPVMVRASMATKTIEKVELYVGSELIATMTEAPYKTDYTASTAGLKTLKAVVTTTDGSTYERQARFTVLGATTKREPFHETVPQLPGTIMVNEYDKGASGVTFKDASRTNVATKNGAWMDYTVDVAEDGIYSFDAEIAAAKDGGAFHLMEYSFDNLDYLSEFVTVPKTGGINRYKTLHGQLLMPLTAGRHVLTLVVDKGGFYMKSLSFSRYVEDKTNITVAISSVKPTTIGLGEETAISITSSSKNSTIDHVNVYANDLLIGTLTEAPYNLTFCPDEVGTYTIKAIATDAEGKSKTSAAKAIKVRGARKAYKGVIAIPGIIEAENFDQGGEGLSFHDSDTKDEGDASYRSDNEGLDLVKGNGGTAIGYTASGEWTEYSIKVTVAGEYSFEATCSNGSSSNGGFTIGLVNGSSVTSLAKLVVKPSGGWDAYTATTGQLTKALAEGEHILRFTINNPSNCNIDKVELKCTKPDGVQIVTTDQQQGGHTIYNLSGQKVGTGYRGIVVRNGRKVLVR